MSNLTSAEKLKLEKILEMEDGYILDFSNRSFQEFILENTGKDIYRNDFDYASGSKANRLRAFWSREDNVVVGNLLLKLLEYWKLQRELNSQFVSLSEKALFEDCRQIAQRLQQNKLKTEQSEQEDTLQKAKQQQANKEYQLSTLLSMFDDMARSSEYQRRGYLLQDLLNRLFQIHEISVTRSFQRNSGGEQIDGAFYFQSWHYLVECKWTKKLADIRELDSLLGKINRSGKQSMGLFLSIEGWSLHVPHLLKQNPDKSIILMEGYDLRCVLSGAITLEHLLNSKITKLNLESEPFLSATEIMNKVN